METVNLAISERQLVRLVKKMSPAGKLQVLRALLPGYERAEEMWEYGAERMRGLAAERGLNWDLLDEAEREQLIDDILHEA